MPRRGQRSLSPSRSIREVRQRMSTVADSSTNILTNLRHVIDVPVVINRGTSITSRKLVTMLVDESATADILCRTSRMEREGDKDRWPRLGML